MQNNIKQYSKWIPQRHERQNRAEKRVARDNGKKFPKHNKIYETTDPRTLENNYRGYNVCAPTHTHTYTHRAIKDALLMRNYASQKTMG